MIGSIEDDNMNLQDRILYRALTGSRAYNLHSESSDYDYRGFYLAPTNMILGINNPPEQITRTQDDDNNYDNCYWEIGKYIKLLLDNNPNVLETLYTGIYNNFAHYNSKESILNTNNERHYLIIKLRINRDRFLSKRLIKTYGGYATSEYKRGLNYIEKGNEKTARKHWMHLHRLLMTVNRFFETKQFSISFNGQNRKYLLSIRNGDMPISAITLHHQSLEDTFNILRKNLDWLPDEPDYNWADEWLVKMRRTVK